jgi:hypothetical protein
MIAGPRQDLLGPVASRLVLFPGIPEYRMLLPAGGSCPGAACEEGASPEASGVKGIGVFKILRGKIRVDIHFLPFQVD